MSDRIKQIYIAQHLRAHFADNLLKHADLVAYHDAEAPSFFYGLLPADLQILQSHKNIGVVIWTGIDCNHAINAASKSTLHTVKRMDNVRHIAISNFIATSLEEVGIDYRYYPFYPFDFEFFAPVEKGPNIYVYCSGNKQVYGYDVIKNVIAPAFPDTTFIYTTHSINYDKRRVADPDIVYYEKDQLVEVYGSCFICLRLTHHDGLAATVQELGCMGIRSVWNGNSPSALSYRTNDDIIAHIENEMGAIGTIDNGLSEGVKQFLRIPDSFYRLESYLN